jgi:hypothetical protein
MNEGKGIMTYDAFMSHGVSTRAGSGAPALHGVPRLAVELGRALENWGRRSAGVAAHPTDREALRREHERQLGIEARMLRNERLGLQHR